MGEGPGRRRPSPRTSWKLHPVFHSRWRNLAPARAPKHPRNGTQPPAGRPQRYSPDSPAASRATPATSRRAGSGSARASCCGFACLRRDMA